MATFRAGIRVSGLAGLALLASGCMCPRVYYAPDGCGPLFPSVRQADCGSMAVSGCAGGCAGECTDGCTTACGTPSCLACDYRLFPNLFGCQAGCGRMYWGEWAYDPPDGCDPCDDCGQWVGRRCGPLAGWYGFWSLVFGVRCNACGSPMEAGCGLATCDSCCDGAVYSDGAGDFGEEVFFERDTAATRSARAPAATAARAPRRTALPVSTTTTTRDPQSRLVRRSRPPVLQ